jgi:hypothetical protein
MRETEEGNYVLATDLRLAAPELLNALKHIIAIGREFYDMDMGPNGAEWIAIGESAIAKAEGRA